MGGNNLEHLNLKLWYTVPNQKIIITVKAESGAEHPYSIDNINAIRQAMRELTDKAFKLYMNMCINKDGFTYPLSPKFIETKTGMTESRYRDAVKELIKKGFLKQSDKQKNAYFFYEDPKAAYIENAESVCKKSEDCISNSDTPSIRNDIDCLSESKGEILYNTTINNKYNNNKNNNYHTNIEKLDELSNSLSDSNRFETKDNDESITSENDDVMPWDEEDY